MRLDREGDGRRCTPESDAHVHVLYEGEAERLWWDSSGAGYDMTENEELRADPVLRLLMRNRWFEEGGTLQTPEGADVTMDAEERRVLLGEGPTAERDEERGSARRRTLSSRE